MIRNKVAKIISVPVLIFMMVSYIAVGTMAADSTGENQLNVFKIVNSLDVHLPNGEYNPSIPLSKQLGSNVKLEGIEGDKIDIFKVDGTANKDDLDKKRNSNSLGDAFRTSTTDKEGKATFENLPDGMYYIVSDSKSGYISSTSLVELPYKSSDSILKKMFIYLKSTKRTPPPSGGGSTPPKQRGGKRFIKVDNSPERNPLEGAGFKLYKKVESSGRIEWTPYKIDGADYVVYSGKDGSFVFDNLEYGEYRVVETVAPSDGKFQYERLERPFDFEVNSKSLEGEAVAIENSPENKVPDKPNTSTEVVPNNPTEVTVFENPSVIKIPKTGDVTVTILHILGALVSFLGLILYKKSAQE